MAFAVAAVAVGAATAYVGYQGYQANKANQQQRAYQKSALEMSRKQADLADQANNKANAKTPDILALLAANKSPGGVGSTMLTGPGGVDTSKLTLGRNTLLGA
ncbi:hypothetical protein [Aquabacterium sp.]|uniref:hypothetical protein n=1 Tax=Aquabacterium sp. TaxID=1872578 RepID=UPI00403847B7